MRRRCSAWISALALVLALFAPTTLAANTVLAIKTPATIPRAGETFEVAVDVLGNPGFSSIQFTLAFDNSKMQCTEIETGALLSGMLSASNPEADGGAKIAAAAASNRGGDGTVATFFFKALVDLDGVEVTVKDIALSSERGESIPSSVSGSALEVAHTPTAKPTITPSPASGGKTPAETAETTAQETAISFPDTAGHWGEAFIEKAVARGLFNGYPDGSFHPDTEISRADFVTVLWRANGSPEPAGTVAFEDVDPTQYYGKAVLWAKEQGYVDGRTATQFAPTGVLTRQEAMKIIFAHSGGASALEGLLTGTYDSGFSDSGEIASWAKSAMYWAYYNEIISGVGNNRLSPTSSLTRAQMAKILVNYLDKFET